MQDGSLSANGKADQPRGSIAFPQITLIDADYITKCPGLYLRYLRHLRADWAGGRVGTSARQFLQREAEELTKIRTVGVGPYGIH